MKKKNKKALLKSMQICQKYNEGFDRKESAINELVGEIIDEVWTDNNELIAFLCKSGKVFQMYHDQDCCESVSIEDIIGNIYNLAGQEILSAYDVTNDGSGEDENGDCSGTYTFYHINTLKDSITIRWYGESNGYYSESVSFYRIVKEEI